MSNILEKLSKIQQAIKVPKDQNNEFAGFKYRSAEDILEKLKPLLKEQEVILILDDNITEISGQAYVKSTAKLLTLDEQSIEVSAYAREEKSRPKMSEGQLTGAASSYARKYALNGLLLLDDNKDPDSQDNTKAKPKVKTNPSPILATEKQRNLITQKLGDIGYRTTDEIKNYLSSEYGISGKLTKEDASMVIEDLTIGEPNENKN